MTLILFGIILLSPIALLIGFIIWLVGSFQKNDENQNPPALLLGKKIMWYALLVFLIGMGSCWGLIGMSSLFGYLLQMFSH